MYHIEIFGSTVQWYMRLALRIARFWPSSQFVFGVESAWRRTTNTTFWWYQRQPSQLASSQKFNLNAIGWTPPICRQDEQTDRADILRGVKNVEYLFEARQYSA